MSDNDWHAEFNRAIRHAARPHDQRNWGPEDWDRYVDELRARGDSEPAGPRPPADAYDARGAGSPSPAPVDPNRVLRAMIRASRRDPLPEDYVE